MRTQFLGLKKLNYSDIIKSVLSDHPMLYYVNIQSVSCCLSAFYQEIEWKLHISKKEIADFDAQLYPALERHEVKSTGKPLIDEVRIHDHLQDMHIGVPTDGEYGAWKFHSIIGPVLCRQSVCEGIAKLFLLLCQRASVPCRVVHGIAKTEKGEEHHAWNQVQLNGQLVHVDATWDCNLQLPTHGYCYDYFNLGDAQMAVDHIWDRSEYHEECVEKYSYFLMAHCVAKSGNELTALLRDRLKSGKNAATVRMQGSWNENDIVNAIQNAIRSQGVGFDYRMNKRQKIIDVRFNR